MFCLIYTAPNSAPDINHGQTKALDDHTIRVAWQEISTTDRNGVILGYTVFYNVKNQSAQFSQNTSGVTSTIIRGLKSYTEYCIRVAGFTKVGLSPKGACYKVITLQSGTLYVIATNVIKSLYDKRASPHLSNTENNLVSRHY